MHQALKSPMKFFSRSRGQLAKSAGDAAIELVDGVQQQTRIARELLPGFAQAAVVSTPPPYRSARGTAR